METWMSGVILIEATMLSFLMALWIAWMSLRGLFRLLPGKSLEAAPIRPAARSVARIAARHIA